MLRLWCGRNWHTMARRVRSRDPVLPGALWCAPDCSRAGGGAVAVLTGRPTTVVADRCDFFYNYVWVHNALLAQGGGLMVASAQTSSSVCLRLFSV